MSEGGRNKISVIFVTDQAKRRNKGILASKRKVTGKQTMLWLKMTP